MGCAYTSQRFGLGYKQNRQGNSLLITGIAKSLRDMLTKQQRVMLNGCLKFEGWNVKRAAFQIARGEWNKISRWTMLNNVGKIKAALQDAGLWISEYEFQMENLADQTN
jgi:hypothetical protein